MVLYFSGSLVEGCHNKSEKCCNFFFSPDIISYNITISVLLKFIDLFRISVLLKLDLATNADITMIMHESNPRTPRKNCSYLSQMCLQTISSIHTLSNAPAEGHIDGVVLCPHLVAGLLHDAVEIGAQTLGGVAVPLRAQDVVVAELHPH